MKKGQCAEHQNKDVRRKIDHALMHKVGAIERDGTCQRPAGEITGRTGFESELQISPWIVLLVEEFRARWGLQVHSLVPGRKLQR